MDGKLRMKPEGAAEALDISLRMLENLITSGDLIVHQDTPGGTRYVSVESMRRYIQYREEQPVIGRFGRKAS